MNIYIKHGLFYTLHIQHFCLRLFFCSFLFSFCVLFNIQMQIYKLFLCKLFICLLVGWYFYILFVCFLVLVSNSLDGMGWWLRGTAYECLNVYKCSYLNMLHTINFIKHVKTFVNGKLPLVVDWLVGWLVGGLAGWLAGSRQPSCYTFNCLVQE